MAHNHRRALLSNQSCLTSFGQKRPPNTNLPNYQQRSSPRPPTGPSIIKTPATNQISKKSRRLFSPQSSGNPEDSAGWACVCVRRIRRPRTTNYWLWDLWAGIFDWNRDNEGSPIWFAHAEAGMSLQRSTGVGLGPFRFLRTAPDWWPVLGVDEKFSGLFARSLII